MFSQIWLFVIGLNNKVGDKELYHSDYKCEMSNLTLSDVKQLLINGAN